MDLTASWVGIAALVTFVLAYAAVIGEEFTHLRKSKPVMLGAGIIWAIIAFEYAQRGMLCYLQMIGREAGSPLCL